jgi:hypothetical protein
MTGGVHLAARERERGVPVRVRALLGCGLDLVLGRMVSPGALFYFYFPFLFSNSVFYFFCIFCKKASIQFKPLSEIF